MPEDDKKRRLRTHQEQLAEQLKKYRKILYPDASTSSNLIQRTCINPLCNQLFGTANESDRLCPKCRTVTNALLDRCLPARDRS